MSKRFGYIYGISNNKNIHKQKFSLTTAGINNNNIFIDYGDSNKEDNNLSKTWNKLLKVMHIGDQLFINNLNNLISKNDMYNINNLSDEILTIRNNVFSIVQKNIEIISLGDEIKINKNNAKNIFHIMYMPININNNYLHDKSNISNSKINRYSNPKMDNSSRISGNKLPLYKNIYLYVKQGHKKTETAKKFHISDSTVYRIIHDFDNLNFFQ